MEMPTLAEVIDEKLSMRGYEMEQVVKTALDSLDDSEAEVAVELQDRYFNGTVSDNYKPLKFVYYRVILNKEGEYTLRRNLYLSPRATGYFSKEDKTADEIRELMRTKKSILGSELKRIVFEAVNRSYEHPTRSNSPEEVAEMSYRNLSKQLAAYIDEYFITCDKPIKDDIWYGVSCREYATATVYRDLEKSPRPQYNRNNK